MDTRSTPLGGDHVSDTTSPQPRKSWLKWIFFVLWGWDIGAYNILSSFRFQILPLYRIVKSSIIPFWNWEGVAITFFWILPSPQAPHIRLRIGSNDRVDEVVGVDLRLYEEQRVHTDSRGCDTNVKTSNIFASGFAFISILKEVYGLCRMQGWFSHFSLKSKEHCNK